MAGEAGDVQSVRRLASVGIYPVCAAAQQRHRALRVAPLHVGQADRELGQSLPQLAMLPRSGLPYCLEYLVRVEGVAIVDQPLGLPDRVVRAEHDILSNPLNPSRTVRQRPAQAVSGTGVAGPPARIPISAVHPCILAG